MRMRAALLAPFFPNQWTAEVCRFVTNSTRVCRWLQADLHLVGIGPADEEVAERIEGLRDPLTGACEIVYGRVDASQVSRILEPAGGWAPDFLIVENRLGFDTEERKTGAQFRRELLEDAADLPTIVVPTTREIPFPPVHSLVVPLSGESRRSVALELALGIAERTDSEVDLVHVAEAAGIQRTFEGALEAVGDEFHHEYAEMIDKVVSSAVPFAGPKERKRVRKLYHGRGSTAGEIRDISRAIPKSMLVLEWKGMLTPGRAKTLKEILSSIESPMLLVRTHREERAILKVARDFDAA